LVGHAGAEKSHAEYQADPIWSCLSSGRVVVRTSARRPPPDPEERSRIEAVLRNEGFTDWRAIALDDDDGVWEVDDAYASDGHRYDLRLHPNTLAIIAREPDDD
jgi:hypothetical protein